MVNFSYTCIWLISLKIIVTYFTIFFFKSYLSQSIEKVKSTLIMCELKAGKLITHLLRSLSKQLLKLQEVLCTI